MRREGGGGGGGLGKIVILSPSTCTEIPNHKTSTKNKQTNKQHSKQAIRRGKLRKISKMFANPIFITPGRYMLVRSTKSRNLTF